MNTMTNSWAFLYDALYPNGKMNKPEPFQSNQFEVEKQRAMSNLEIDTNPPPYQEYVGIRDATSEDWEDFWYDSQSEGKDVSKDTTPKTFSYDGWIPKKVFGIQTKHFYEKNGRPFMG
jgi:hypothetical protein